RATPQRGHAGGLRHARRQSDPLRRRPRPLPRARRLGDRGRRRRPEHGDAFASVRHRDRRAPGPRPRRRRGHTGRRTRAPRPLMFATLMFITLLGEHFVHTALLAGAVVAVVAGAIGVFVVMRGLSFAVHAISELGFTGATGALVIGPDPVLGMLGGSLAGGAALGALSLRGRERDSAIGAVLAFGL